MGPAIAYALWRPRPLQKASVLEVWRHCRSVAHQVTSRTLAPHGTPLTRIDGGGVGQFTLLGSRELATVRPEAMQRVRLLWRGGWLLSAPLVVQAERHVAQVPTRRPGGGQRCAAARLGDGRRGAGARSSVV